MFNILQIDIRIQNYIQFDVELIFRHLRINIQRSPHMYATILSWAQLSATVFNRTRKKKLKISFLKFAQQKLTQLHLPPSPTNSSQYNPREKKSGGGR